MDIGYSRSGRRGFSLVELLVVVSIVALLIGLLLPALARAREEANRVVCSAHVRGMAQSLIAYAGVNSGEFPATPGEYGPMYINSPLPPGHYFTGQTASQVVEDWFNLNGGTSAFQPSTGSVVSCLWLMVLLHYQTPAEFICPSDPFAHGPSLLYGGAPGATQWAYGNFGNLTNNQAQSNFGQGESYSVAYPWVAASGNDVPAEIGSWWTTRAGTEVPILSDMAPDDYGSPALGLAYRNTTLFPGNTFGNYVYNSGNHNGDGQNVGFADGHVTWKTTPYCGMAHDNIFTYDQPVYTRIGDSPSAPQTGLVCPPNVVGFTNPVLSNAIPYDTCMAPVRNVATGEW
ncbi:MAG: type II secretion system protein [Phycisphaerae bacterium]